jgi:hypothetical protein
MKSRTFTHLAAALAAAGALLAVGLGASAASAATASPASGFSVRPVEFNPANPATRAYFIATVSRGSIFTDHIAVVNPNSQAIELLAYPVSGLTGTTSGDVYANRQDPRTGAGAWLTHATESISVPADSQFTAAFTVRVPAGAVPGDHLAGMAFQAAQQTVGGGHFAITEIVREVVGVEIIVRGAASPKIALRGATLAALPGTNFPAVVVKLTNTGRQLCKPVLTVSLQRPGQKRLVVSRPLDTVLPTNSIAYPFQWPRALAAGSYTTTVKASGCGKAVTLTRVTKLGSALKRVLPIATILAVVPPPSSSLGWWVFVLIAVGCIGLGALVSRGLRRRRPAGL